MNDSKHNYTALLHFQMGQHPTIQLLLAYVVPSKDQKSSTQACMMDQKLGHAGHQQRTSFLDPSPPQERLLLLVQESHVK